MKKALSPFSKKIIGVIKKIPKGKVATYGQIARLAGKSGGARSVVWILHSCSKSHNLPWHRVLSSKGKISFSWATSHYARQKNKLLAEKIKFNENDTIDFKKYQWKK